MSKPSFDKTATPSSPRRSASQQEALSSLAANVHSLNDSDLVKVLEEDPQVGDFLRENVDSVSIRERNLTRSRRSPKPVVSQQELAEVLETNDENAIVGFLHDLDDKSFLAFSKDPEVKETIRSESSLSKRLNSIKESKSNSSEVRSVTRQVTPMLKSGRSSDRVASRSTSPSKGSRASSRSPSPVRTTVRSTRPSGNSEIFSPILYRGEDFDESPPSPSKSKSPRNRSMSSEKPTRSIPMSSLDDSQRPPNRSLPRTLASSKIASREASLSKLKSTSMRNTTSQVRAPIGGTIFASPLGSNQELRSFSQMPMSGQENVAVSMPMDYYINYGSASANSMTNNMSLVSQEQDPLIPVLTGDMEEDIETLIDTPDAILEEILDPEIFIQDEVTEEIRAIIASPEYRSARTKKMSPTNRLATAIAAPPVQHKDQVFYAECQLVPASERKKYVTWSQSGSNQMTN